MGEIGYAALLLTFAIALYSAIATVWGTRQGLQELTESGRRGVVAIAGLVTVSVLALLYLLITNDFRFQYVYDSTSTFQPLVYHISALWQGQSGSILFWLWALSLLALFLIVRQGRSPGPEMPYALALLSALEAAFAVLLLISANPFAPAEKFYTEGFGGNPLLENPGMIYHPPTILAGYAATAIPFALLITALLTGRLEDGRGLRRLRAWVLLAWFLLTIGILLGAQWAYVELGWGGYWAWDPVENASLIPWLVTTALLHSLMMQERRGMFKLWNAVLISASFLLCIFATWVTRGGAINSVHSFGESAVGNLFSILLVALTIFSVVVIRNRRRLLRSSFEVEDLSSREAGFLYTTFFFCGAAFLVFLGTIFPALSQGLSGRQVAWGAEGFESITRILGPLLLVLLGICPVLGWRRTDRRQLSLNLALSVGVAALVALGVAVITRGPVYGVLAFALVGFVSATILSEFYRGWRIRLGKGEGPAAAFLRLVSRNRHRYGGYLVHLGVLCMIVAITGQSLYQSKEEVALKPGEAVTVGTYRVQYNDSGTEETPTNRRFYASLQVYRGDRPIATLQPERDFYFNVEQWVTEVALRPTLTEDLYVLLLGVEADGLATFEILVNPLVSWLWIGGVVLAIGAVIALWPAGHEATSLSVAEQGEG